MHSVAILIAKVLPLRPEAVVLMHNVNDFAVLFHDGSYWEGSKNRSLVVVPQMGQAVASRSDNLFEAMRSLKRATFPYLSHAISMVARGSQGWSVEQAHGRVYEMEPDWRSDGSSRIDEGPIVTSFTQALDLFISACRSHDVTPVLMTQAARLPQEYASDLGGLGGLKERLRAMGIPYREFARVHGSLNETIRATAARTNTELIDLEVRIEKSSFFMYDYVHFTNKGSRVAAAVIADHLTNFLADKI